LNCTLFIDDTSKDPPQLHVIARAGDEIGGTSYAKVKATEFSQVVLTLVSEEKANAMGAYKCKAHVGNLHDDGNNIIPFADMNWSGTAHGEAPVAIVVDKFYPVPPGYNACTGHRIRTPLPADTPASSIHPSMRVWADGVRYLLENTQGRSFHMGDFNGPIADTNFHTNEDPTPDGQFAEDMAEISPYLADTCIAPLKVVLSSQAAVQDNYDAINDHIVASLRPEANLPEVQDNLRNAAPPAASVPPADQTSVNQGLIKVLEGLNASIKMSKEGSKVSQKMKNINLAKNCYSLLMGQKVRGPDGEWILEPMPLEPAFVEVLEQTSDKRALVEFTSGLRQVAESERSKNTLLGHKSDLNRDTMNKATVTCIRNYQWHAKPMNTCHQVLDRALSILQFLPCGRLSKAFVNFNTSSRARKFDDATEDDDDKKGAICVLSPFGLVPLSSKNRVRKIVDGYFDATTVTVKEMAILLGHLHCLNNYIPNSNSK